VDRGLKLTVSLIAVELSCCDCVEVIVSGRIVLFPHRDLGLGTESRSEKNPRIRLGTVFVIPRKKVLIPRHSEFRGRTSSEARNGREFREKKYVLQNSRYKNRGFFLFFSYLCTLFNTVYLPPIRFHCVGGRWDRTQASCDFGLGCLSDALATRLHIIHYTRLHLIHTRLHLIHTRLHLIHTRLHLIHYSATSHPH
jgi:hypothetical protein